MLIRVFDNKSFDTDSFGELTVVCFEKTTNNLQVLPNKFKSIGK